MKFTEFFFDLFVVNNEMGNVIRMNFLKICPLFYCSIDLFRGMAEFKNIQYSTQIFMFVRQKIFIDKSMSLNTCQVEIFQ